MTDSARRSLGFLSVSEVRELISPSNIALDENSLLVSKSCVIGKGNIFYPNVTIRDDRGSLTIGNDNVFHSGTAMEASAGAVLVAGDANVFGEGVVVIRANQPGVSIRIGSHTRIVGVVYIYGGTSLGDGTQILGNITLHGCSLEGGGDHRCEQPDERGGVVKGMGTARNLQLRRGQVVNGLGDFANAPIERQSAYHPKRR